MQNEAKVSTREAEMGIRVIRKDGTVEEKPSIKVQVDESFIAKLKEKLGV